VRTPADEPAASGAVPDAASSSNGEEPPEVLVLGPSSGHPRRWRWTALLVVVALFLAAGGWVFQHRQATSPTFTTDEVVKLYSRPGDAGADEITWDPSTVDSSEEGEDRSDLVTLPAECAPITSFAAATPRAARVIVELREGSNPDESRVSAGTVFTRLYESPGRARSQYDAVVAALGTCKQLSIGKDRVGVADVSVGQDVRLRSDLTFQLSLGELQPAAFRVRLVRFGNSLTWSVVDESRQAEGAPIPDRVVKGLQKIYRQRA